MKNKLKPVFAVFDFDNTCITNDIEEATLDYMATNNLFKDKKLLGSAFKKYYKLLDSGKVKEAYEFCAKILSGFSVDEVAPLVEKVLKFKKDLKLRKQVIELINFLKNNGVDVWVVSASAEVLVKIALKYFGIEANVIGVRNIIVDGKITSELEKPLSVFEGKVECIKKFIDKEACPLLGVGDSINDLAMLEYCNIKVVVDRANDLTKIAKQNNWFLI